MSGESEFNALVAKIRTLHTKLLGAMSVEQRQQRLKEVNWETGRYIVESVQDGELRAAYGQQLLAKLSERLSKDLGTGFSERNLLYSRNFFEEYNISQTSAKLTWSHYVSLLSLPDKGLRRRLEKEAVQKHLTHAELSRQVAQRKLETWLESEERTPPTPRKARFNLCKVVQRSHGEKPHLALDLGFHMTEPISTYRAVHLKDGDFVRWAKVNDGFQLKPVTCEAGERYCYRGFLQHVVDGDTLLVDMMLANGRGTLQRLRLRGVMAMEPGTPKGDECKKFVERLIKIGTRLKILTYGTDRYGRYVADVFVGRVFVNKHIMDNRLG
ncbi:MAG: hypothetical protein JXX29_14730 [Deltaproteobacteria bacterium]|nr:hypothetical protein [Deltaproteobacteria bacterium]MBN2672935.1 hypothetical protein [Deltaproteobacteria bacterium]